MKTNVILCTLLFLTSSLFAQTQDKWKVNLGSMFVTNFQTDMQLGKKGVPIGAKINTKDQLGLDSSASVFRLDGYYRFNDVHSIDISYFGVKTNSSRFIANEIEWDDTTISDADINVHFDMDVFKLNYGYSFYHNDDVELMLTAGLHITSINLGLKASGVVNGTPQQTINSGAKVTVPLPVFGFKGEYTILPNTLFVTYKAEYFFLQFDIYQGSFISNMFTLEYRFLDHYGVGAGFNSNTINMSMEDDAKKIDLRNELNGLMLYLSYTY